MTGTTVIGCKYAGGVMTACDTLGAPRPGSRYPPPATPSPDAACVLDARSQG